MEKLIEILVKRNNIPRKEAIELLKETRKEIIEPYPFEAD